MTSALDHAHARGPGDVVAGRFELVRRAGAGGMGVVFEAMDRASRTRVAVKLVEPRQGASAIDPELAARFARESELLASVEHPRVVRYIAHGIDERGAPWLAMEWLDGETLASRLGRGRLGLVEAFELVSAIAGALATVHHRGIVHRDVKPNNVLLELGKGPKLLDFGVARAGAGAGAGDPATAGLTETGAMLGTLGYMAPEQARGERNLKPAADVFALGAIFYACLTGRAAFEGSDPIALLMQLVDGQVTPPRARCPAIPASVEALVMSMLEKDASRRPATGVAVVHALTALEREVRDAALTPEAPPSAESFAVPRAAQSGSIAVETAGKGLWIAVGLGVAAASAAAIVTVVLLTQHDARATGDPSKGAPSGARPAAPRSAAPCAGVKCEDAPFADLGAVDLLEGANALDAFARGFDPAVERVALGGTCVSNGAVDLTSVLCTLSSVYQHKDATGAIDTYLSVYANSGRLTILKMDPTLASSALFPIATPTCSSMDAFKAAKAYAPQASFSDTAGLAPASEAGEPSRWSIGRVADAPILVDGATCEVLPTAQATNIAAPPPLPFAVGQLVVVDNQTDNVITGIVITFTGGERRVAAVPGKSTVEVHVPRVPRSIDYTAAGRKQRAEFDLASSFENSNGKIALEFRGGPEPIWNLKRQDSSHVLGDAATCTEFRSCCTFDSMSTLSETDPVNAACAAAEKQKLDCARARDGVVAAIRAAARPAPRGCPAR